MNGWTHTRRAQLYCLCDGQKVYGGVQEGHSIFANDKIQV